MSYTDYEYFKSLTVDRLLSKNFLQKKREIRQIMTIEQIRQLGLIEENFVRGGEAGENSPPAFYRELGFSTKKAGQAFRRKYKITLYNRSSRTHPKSFRELRNEIQQALREENLLSSKVEIITIKESETINIHQIGLFDDNEKLITYYDAGTEAPSEFHYRIWSLIPDRKSARFLRKMPYKVENFIDYLTGYNLGSYEKVEGERGSRRNWGTFTITKQLAQAINNLDYFETTKILKSFLKLSKDDFNFNAYIQLKISKTDANKKERIEGSPFNLLDYIVNKIRYRIPFTNYSDNDEGNCIYDWAKNRYSKIKKLDKYLKTENNSVGDILNFCKAYNIELKLFNLAGMLLIANEGNDKHYPRWVGILGESHFYPLDAKGVKNLKPQLNKNVLGKDSKDKDDEQFLFYEKNGVKYYRNGKISSDLDKLNMKLFKDEFSYKLTENFTFQNDVNKIKPLKYVDPNYEKIQYEYDMIKSYFNIAMNFMEDGYKCPVFSCLDVWKPYNTDERIEDYSYYLLSRQAIENLLTIGIYDGLQDGYIIKLLLQNNKISSDDIEYVKQPSYMRSWETIRSTLAVMLKELGADHINENYPFYNGMLGKDVTTHNLKIGYLHEDELLLLGNAFQQIEGEGEKCIFEMRSSFYNHINSVTLYNSIVSSTNRLILMNIFSSTQPILKISVDAIAYQYEEEIHHRPDLFKVLSIDGVRLVNKQNLPIGYDKYEKPQYPKKYWVATYPHYYNGQEVATQVYRELEQACLKNKAYLGEGGSGKSHNIKLNSKYDLSTTITNQCCANISEDTQTCYKMLGGRDPVIQAKMMKRLKSKTVWVDEVSMIGTEFLNRFVAMSLSGNTNYIFSGDFEQLPPIEQKGLGMDEHSKLILGKIFDTTQDNKNYRMDEELTILSRTIRMANQTEKNLAINKHKCISTINTVSDFKKLDLHICYKHSTKRYINHSIMKDRSLTFDLNTNFVSDGVVLRVVRNCKAENLKKGELFRVIGGQLHSITNPLKILKNYSLKNLDVGFASTTHSFQGNTIREPICLHDLKYMINVDRLLYTAITRATKLCNLYKCVQIGSSQHIYNENREKMKNDLVMI